MLLAIGSYSYILVLCDNRKSVIIAVINIIVIVIIKFFIIVIGNCSEFTVKILPLVEKYDIKVGVLTWIWLTVYQLSTGNSGWHIMKNTMGAFNSVLVNFMHT